MISYQALLNEIEVLVTNAKNVKDEQQIREQLAALRSLCNVALSQNKDKQSVQQASTTIATPVNQSNQQGNSIASMNQSNQQGNFMASMNQSNQQGNSIASMNQSNQQGNNQASMNQTIQSNIANQGSSLNGSKLNENDANGESIFDF